MGALRATQRWRRFSAPHAKRASIRSEAMREYPAPSRRAGLQHSLTRVCHTMRSAPVRMAPDACSATRRRKTRRPDPWLGDGVNPPPMPSVETPRNGVVRRDRECRQEIDSFDSRTRRTSAEGTAIGPARRISRSPAGSRPGSDQAEVGEEIAGRAHISASAPA